MYPLGNNSLHMHVCNYYCVMLLLLLLFYYYFAVHSDLLKVLHSVMHESKELKRSEVILWVARWVGQSVSLFLKYLQHVICLDR